MVKSVHLDQKFWTHFSKNIWQKKPLLVKNVKSALLEINDAEIFKLLVLYSDRCRKLKNCTGFKFYINGVQTHEQDVLQVLPVKKDKSLLGYHNRIKEIFSDYCLVCDELLQTNTEKQNVLTDFTDELYRHVGFPNRFTEMGLYLGNYRKTPFGVHVDGCGVFSFPVVGTKKFRLWTDAYVKKNPQLDRTFKYEKFKKDSQLISVEVGDLSYWPSSAWHIAESDGSFSATWSLGVWVDQSHEKTFSESLSGMLQNKLGRRGLSTTTSFKTLYETSGEVKTLPSDFVQSIELLKNLTTAELHENFLKYWMVHISLQGFKNIPEFDFKIELKSELKLRSDRSKILWLCSRVEKSKIFFSFGGTLIESTKESGLYKLVQSLNSEKPCLVSDYITSKRDLLCLQKLAKAGAFI